MLKNIKLCVMVVVCVALLAACGNGGGSTAKDQVSANKVEKNTKVDHSKPAVGADVIGLKLGMTESQVRKIMEADGWVNIKDQKRLENIPGENPYEYAETLHYTRERQENGEYVYEVAGIHFVPKVKGEGLARIITFDRMIHERPAVNQNYRAGGKQVTSEFSTSTLALMKKKYGEPYKVLDSACRSYGGTTNVNIPIYELNYYPNVRSYTRAGGMQIKISDTCQQTFSIRIEDQDFATYIQKEFNDYVQKKLGSATANTNKKIDF
ncbi:MAG: hypothetical protein KC618_05500 [Candidatus Omnitrophica bacterium]|nr:hypothetical protein [Candidatus Omnitrophota bacterium]